MDTSFEQLKSMIVFAHIVEQGSFSAAAKKLGISRGVVSYHLKKLELHIGVPLLNRTTRSFSLTAIGEQYYQRCQRIQEEAALAHQSIENTRDEPEGKLTISAPINLSQYTLIPALNQFKRLYPKIELHVNLTDDVVNIVQEGVDLAIRGAALVDSGLHARKLMTIDTLLCATPTYLQQHGTPKHPSDLGRHQWVMYSKGAKILTLSQGQKTYSITQQGGLYTNSAQARTAFVLGHHGIGKLPWYDAKPWIANGQLIPILTDYQLAPIVVYGVYPPRASQTKKMQLLLNHLSEAFRTLECTRDLDIRK